MGYVDQNLISGEKVTYRGQLHWIVIAGSLFIFLFIALPGLGLVIYGYSNKDSVPTPAAVAGAALFVFGTFPVIKSELHRRAAEFAVTNKRVILKQGMINRKTVEMFLQKVESIDVDQNLAGRMFDYGTITLRGTGGSFEPFARVSRPLEFRRQVQEQIGKQYEPAGKPSI